MTEPSATVLHRALAGVLLAAAVACGGGGARGGETAPRLAAGDSVGAAAACPDSAAPADAAPADIEVTATVRARSLEHRVPPRTGVSFPGAGARDTLSCDTRRNLDRPVRAGRTYRDVEVQYRLRVRLDSAAARVLPDSVPAARDSARSP